MTAAGVIAQLMSVPERLVLPELLPALRVPERARTSAVLALFGSADDDVPADTAELRPADLDIVLQVRSASLRNHPGQMSFPGGSREAGDATLIDTALRETWEETGIAAEDVQVLSRLPELPLVASNFLVTPVLGWRRRPVSFAHVQQSESSALMRVPVAHLLDPANRFTSVFRRDAGEFRGPAWDVDGTVLWGFTAVVLNEVFNAAGWTQPWDVERERSI